MNLRISQYLHIDNTVSWVVGRGGGQHAKLTEVYKSDSQDRLTYIHKEASSLEQKKTLYSRKKCPHGLSILK